MTKRIVTRGNTVFFTFLFYDEDDVLADCTSADLQLTYPGANGYETEVIALEVDGNEVWSGQWVSTAARPGWVEYHVHAIATLGEYAEDGRFRLTGNRASLDHDTLPSGSATVSDYELTP